MKRGIMLFCVGLLVLVSSCTTFQASNLQMGLSARDSDYQVMGDFYEKVWTNKFLGTSGAATLFNLSQSATDIAARTAIERNIRKLNGTSAMNIKVSYGSNPLHWLLNMVTLGIWAPGTITVSGTVIKER